MSCFSLASFFSIALYVPFSFHYIDPRRNCNTEFQCSYRDAYFIRHLLEGTEGLVFTCQRTHKRDEPTQDSTHKDTTRTRTYTSSCLVTQCLFVLLFRLFSRCFYLRSTCSTEIQCSPPSSFVYSQVSHSDTDKNRQGNKRCAAKPFFGRARGFFVKAPI